MHRPKRASALQMVLYTRLSGSMYIDIVPAASRLAPRVRAVLDVLTSSLFFLFVITLLYYGGTIAWESVDSMETSYSAWNPPVWPFKIAIPVAALLLLLQGIAKLVEDIAIAVGAIEPPAVASDRDSNPGETA